ncbi:MAG TPA: hypothetical protein VHD91_00205 [Gaiellaceae bacterium]|nr:hypothetical protein [Gaiellaceae bacterium]
MKRLRLGIATGAIAAAFAVPAASAATATPATPVLSGALASLANCGYDAGSPVFSRWLDPFSYSLAPQGDLASTNGWTLSGATRSSSHDSYGLSTGSLAFTHNGDSATTPWMCVNLQNPTVRFLTIDQGGLGLGTFVVVLRYLTPNGSVVRLPISVAKPLRSWEPSLPVVLGLNLLSIASTNGWTAVSLELDATGLVKGETISADGFYVDPCRSR